MKRIIFNVKHKYKTFKRLRYNFEEKLKKLK